MLPSGRSAIRLARLCRFQRQAFGSQRTSRSRCDKFDPLRPQRYIHYRDDLRSGGALTLHGLSCHERQLFQAIPHGDRPPGPLVRRRRIAARLPAAGLGSRSDRRARGSQVLQLSARDRRRRICLPGRLRRLLQADVGDQRPRRFPGRGDVACRVRGRRHASRSISAGRFKASAFRVDWVAFRTSASRRRIDAAAWERR